MAGRYWWQAASPDMLIFGLCIVFVAGAAIEATVTEQTSSSAQRHLIVGARDHDPGTILYILATNFLLYTALVLITYLVVKLYIENSPDNPLFDDEITFHRLPATSSGIELPVKFTPKGTSPNRGPAPPPAPASAVSPPGPYAGLGVASKGIRRTSGTSILDFEGEADHVFQNRQAALKKLVGCAVGLNVTFVIWGVLQERILRMEYGGGEFFTYSYGLVFTSRFLGLCLSGAMMYQTRPVWSKAVAYEYSFPSVSNMMSSWCQYEALKYVTFPTQILSKSFKIVPIMIMGKVLGDKEYPFYDYVVAGTIGLGISLFLSSSEGLHLGMDMGGELQSRTGVTSGILLLGLYLVFDAFTSQWQSRMFTKHKDLSPVQMMFVMNAFSTVFSLVTLVHTSELAPFFSFVVQHPEIHIHFLAFSVASTIGQLLIFHTIRSFGAVMFAIIMTTRIALSILVSCLIYHHKVTEMGWVGLFIVFGAVGYRIKRRMEGSRLLKWQGMDDSETPKLFREWHEHLDF